MQKINVSDLINRAKELLSDGTVDRVLGWKKGEFGYDVTPYVFRSVKELEEDFTYGDFCGANLSKYLVKETGRSDKKAAVFLKPCDTYSFNQLITEHRIDRDKAYVIGVSCSGMADVSAIKDISGDGIVDIKENGEFLCVYTLYGDSPVQVKADKVKADRCVCCKSRRHAAYDELMGNTDEDNEKNDRFAGVEKLEAMSSEERYAFWQNELSRCIRCNACRDVCPACTCEKCVFDNPASGLENKAAANEFEEKLYHLIRAFHVAGRCTDCGECSRVCPSHIPLHLLNRKFIKDINTFYGKYQAGAEVGSRSPLVDFGKDDPEPSDAVGRGGL